MIRIDGYYSDYYDLADPKYPGGKAVPASDPYMFDGTNWRALFFNDIIGAKQALFIEAFGSLENISGLPDNVEQSDVLKAIKELIRKAIPKYGGDRCFIKNITVPETIIPLEELEIEWSAEKNYSVFISPHGKFLDFKLYGTAVKEDGLYIWASGTIDDDQPNIQGTFRRWGDGGLWGDGGRWGEGEESPDSGTIPVNILIKEF